jgi:hypothetical protein
LFDVGPGLYAPADKFVEVHTQAGLEPGFSIRNRNSLNAAGGLSS